MNDYYVFALRQVDINKIISVKVNLSKEKANALKRLITINYNLPKKPCSRSKSILPRKTPSEFDHSQNASKPEFEHNLKSLNVLNKILNSNFSNQDEFLQIFDQQLEQTK